MTVETVIGVVAAVYRTPLPQVWAMPLCSIMAWFRSARVVLPLVDPMASEPEPEPDPKAQMDALQMLIGGRRGA